MTTQRGSLSPPIVDVVDLVHPDHGLDQIPMRAVFTNAADSELVQVQRTSFVRNWRKTSENAEYTHYLQLKPKFHRDWDRLLGFLERSSLSLPQVFQGEVTYVNHLVRGAEWSAYSDIGKLLKPLAAKRDVSDDSLIYRYLPPSSSIAAALSYTLVELEVSLEVAIQSVVRQSDGAEAIQLTITAKGKPGGSSHDSLSSVLDRCHEAVVMSFDDLTTTAAHVSWGKR